MRLAILLLIFSICRAVAQEQNILPSEFPANRYSRIWENSPFNREVVAQIQSKPRSAFASSYVLEGLVSDTSGPIAYVRDLQGGDFLVVTKKKSPGSALFLVDAKKGKNPVETVVKISDGKETAEIRYAEGAYTQKIESPAPPTPKTQPTKGGPNPNALVNPPPTSPGAGNQPGNSANGTKGAANGAKGPTNGAKAKAAPDQEKAKAPQPPQSGDSAPPAPRPRSGIIIPTKPPASSSN